MDEFEPAERFAQTVWTYGTADDVWTAIFDAPRSRFREAGDEYAHVDVAAELLERIERSPDFAVGDLTHDECISAVHRRYPILGPNPFGA